MSGWMRVPVAALAIYRNGYPFKPADRGIDGLPIVRIEQFQNPDAEVDRHPGDSVPDANRISSGDLIFSWSGTLAVDFWNRGPALLNQHLFRVDPLRGVEARWLRWALTEAIERMKPLMHGSAMTHITRRVLEETRVPVPPLEEQRRIADYLDTETAHIDTLLAKNTHAATLVEERVRNEFAGLLNQDSDDIFIRTPADTRCGPPVGLVAQTFTGKTLQSQQVSDEDERVPYVTASNVMDGGIVVDGDKRMWATPTEVEQLSVHAGDVLVIEGGATAGRAVLLEFEPASPTILQNYVHCVRPVRGWTGRYLGAVLRAYYESGWYAHYAAGVTFGSFPASKLRALVVPQRTLAEQRLLVEGLDRLVSESDAVNAQLARQADLLRERRQALITAAVTGEIEV